MNPHNFRQGAGCGVCADIATSERQRGENSHFYYHDLSEEEREQLITVRKPAEYKEWRRQVHARHNYECAICGSNEEIRAHHLYGFSYYDDLTTDVENGVTLCARHHDRF
jgi:predicted restriction endonuclease